MKAVIMPGSAKGIVNAPPSKSMAHRMLIGAGLAEGISRIENIDLSEDIKATLGVLEAMGVEYSICDHTVTMRGIGGNKVCAKQKMDCKESGSTLRFFIPILLTGGQKCEFIGAKRLFERPLDVYEDICKKQGIFFRRNECEITLEGSLQATHYRIACNISSQFITGLLFALPLLAQDSVLELLPPVESKAYIDLTLEVLAMCGVEVKQEKDNFYIKGKQIYKPIQGAVEGDYSNAAFLEAFNRIGGSVQVEGLKKDSLQGDKIYQIYFDRLQKKEPVIDISECPDLGPILMGMAAAGHGAVFTGTRRLKIKESDRGAAMAQELQKFGIACEVMENKIKVFDGKLQKPKEILDGHNDHRIVMTMAVLSSITGGTIEGCEAVKKSFPNFFDVMSNLGIRVTVEDK